MKYSTRHRHGEGGSEIGSPDGVMTAATTTIADDARSASCEQLLRRDHADELQEHEQHRELEADAEGGDHQPDEADVLADLEQPAPTSLAAPGDEELERLLERDVGEEPAEQEQRRPTTG